MIKRLIFVLFAALILSASTNPTPIFDDVPASAPLFVWVQKAAEIGLATDCNPGKFCPNDPVTIQDLETFIERLR